MCIAMMAVTVFMVMVIVGLDPNKVDGAMANASLGPHAIDQVEHGAGGPL